MNPTVLLVCSDPLNLTDLETLLLRQGYKVIAADSGEAALALCPQLQPDLVLLNDLLPDMPGAEVCRRLKENPSNRLTPVVLIAAPGDVSDLSRALESGVDDLWGPRPAPWEAFSRVHSLLQLKTYIDEQAESVIFSLARSIEARDRFAAGHGVRVSNYAARLGTSLGLSKDDVEALRIAGLVHDIGKIGIPESILLKPGPLNSEEIAIVEQHPAVGEQICAPLKSLRHILPIIRHHHERMNGSGYPDGLQGDRIPLTARILHIVDICDALTNDRPYRKCLPLPSALITLYEEVDRGWLEQDLVNQFASLVLGTESLAALGKHAIVRNLEAAQ